jgi:hypothetical protein
VSDNPGALATLDMCFPAQFLWEKAAHRKSFQERFGKKAGKGISPKSADHFFLIKLNVWMNYTVFPICFMYRLFTNIYRQNDPNVGEYT